MKPLATLKASKLNQKESSSDLEKPGDFVITRAGIAGSIEVINAVVMKCPYCGMDMMTTSIHTIHVDPTWRKLLSWFGLKCGVTVTPQIQCPFNKAHTFVLQHGMIYPFQQKNG